MTAPTRLRLSRARGFDLQAHSRSVNGLEAVNVARPSIFGNPFVVGKDGDRAECAELYRAMLGGLLALGRTPKLDELMRARAEIAGDIRRLKGKNLACWCRLDGKPCHAEVLVEIANDPRLAARIEMLACAIRLKALQDARRAIEEGMTLKLDTMAYPPRGTFRRVPLHSVLFPHIRLRRNNGDDSRERRFRAAAARHEPLGSSALRRCWHNAVRQTGCGWPHAEAASRRWSRHLGSRGARQSFFGAAEG